MKKKTKFHKNTAQKRTALCKDKRETALNLDKTQMRKKQALKSFAVLEYFDYSEGYYLMCKNTLGVLAYAGSFSKNFYSLKPIPQI